MKAYKVLAVLKASATKMKAGDTKVLICGKPLDVDYYFILDDVFLDAVDAFTETLAELERVKKHFVMPNHHDLKAMRKNRWLSMGQVEKACGVSKSTISRIEKGSDADYSNVKKLVEFYQSYEIPVSKSE